MSRLPIAIFIVVFVVSITLTQYLAYQQYKISKETKRTELVHEATEAKDRFRNILFNDIAAANTLAIIYKQYGVPANFDSVAHQIIQASRYADALQITENGMVRNVYPDTRYKGTIGTNVNHDPVRKAEEDRAIEHKDIYFAGPRRLRFGDTGILGKVPIVMGNKVVAVTTVRTLLPTIKKMLANHGAGSNKFTYQLVKTQGKKVSFFLLSDLKPADKSEYIDLDIPEGDWQLRVSFAEGYFSGAFPFELSGLGILFSFIVALLVYRKVQEPYKLKKIIDEKTEQLAKSEKYFRTLIETSSDAIVLLGPTGLVLYQSPSTDKILGYSLAEVQQMDGLQLIHPDDREADNNIFYKEISELNAVVQRSHRIKHKNGDYIHIEGTYRNLLHDENINAIVYSYKDVTEKVLSAQILIESENRFRSAFEYSAIGMGITSIQGDLTGRWLKVNHSLCDMLGYTEAELLSRTFMQITHPDDLAMDLAAQERILQGELDTYRIDKRYIHKDGSTVWINLNVSIVKGKDKKPMYLVAQIENITERLESQNKFQNLVENFVVGVYILQNNKIVYVNPRVIEETGYKEDEIIDMPFDCFIYPEDLELVSQNIVAKAKNYAEATRYDARIQPKDGKPIWYEMLGSSILYHGAPAQIGTMVNITERKAIYDELIRSEANLKSIFDTTDISYLLLDTNYNIIAFNQQMKNIYIEVAGFELREGHNFFELMLPEKREKARAIYDRTVETNRSEDYETTYENDAIYRHFLANVKPIHDGTKVIGICVSIMDITERKKMTIDLVNQLEAIEVQNEKLREIAWIQSHVVRAPLAKIMGLIDMFTGCESNDADQHTILGYILVSAKELDEVVKSISDKVHDSQDDYGRELK
jgi:PAS domain S-box-containing protein